MVIELNRGQRFDTRGLPEGYDPHKLYEYRHETLVKDGTGFESFLYKLIPFSMVKSFAFALDPTAEFKVSTMPITNANRTRYRGSISVLNAIRVVENRYYLTYAQVPNYKGVSICWSPTFDYYVSSTGETANFQVGNQEALHDRIKDTTRRTRLFGSDYGTYELFKGYKSSPGRKVRYGLESRSTILTGTATNEPLCGAVGGTYNKFRFESDIKVRRQFPSSSRLSLTRYNQLRDGEIALSKAYCQSNAVSMLKSITPFNRDYTLGRNLVELRDIPRSVVSIQQTALNLRKLFLSLYHSPKTRKVIFNLKGSAKDVPNEYLSYHFGWKQLWKDVNDLLNLPEKMSKKVSFLIRRSGKPTTLRSTRDILSGSSGVSGFEYYAMTGESSTDTQSRIVRSAQVRLVVNSIWEFPPINSVQFKHHIFNERTGIEPRITDIYNLIPWTWLVDWFTGLGNYVELIDIINHDPKLINWGLISCSIKGRLVTDFSSKSTVTSEVGNGGPFTVTSTTVTNRHTSFFDYECNTRSDVATILDVKLTSVPATLSPYQMSILGALIAQRTKFSR